MSFQLSFLLANNVNVVIVELSASVCLFNYYCDEIPCIFSAVIISRHYRFRGDTLVKTWRRKPAGLQWESFLNTRCLLNDRSHEPTEFVCSWYSCCCTQLCIVVASLLKWLGLIMTDLCWSLATIALLSRYSKIKFFCWLEQAQTATLATLKEIEQLLSFMLFVSMPCLLVDDDVAFCGKFNSSVFPISFLIYLHVPRFCSTWYLCSFTKLSLSFQLKIIFSYWLYIYWSYQWEPMRRPAHKQSVANGDRRYKKNEKKMSSGTLAKVWLTDSSSRCPKPRWQMKQVI